MDDDTDFLTATEEFFKATGAEILTCTDGNTAKMLIEKEQPFMVILDAMLPKRSGFLVLEGCKAKKPKEAEPHIIMVTANTGKRHQGWAECLGTDDYLTKPFEMRKLMDSARRIAEQYA